MLQITRENFPIYMTYCCVFAVQYSVITYISSSSWFILLEMIEIKGDIFCASFLLFISPGDAKYRCDEVVVLV